MYSKYVELRDSKNLSDYRVAIDTGIPKSTFSDWKNKRSEPKIDKLQKIADYFKVPLTVFTDVKKKEANKKKE